MTDRELLQRALVAIEVESKGYADKVARNRRLIADLKERLLQTDPGAWREVTYDQLIEEVRSRGYEIRNAKIVVSQPRREWVGLTEQDYSAINQSCLTKIQSASSAEEILREKNHE